jgi:hypothetical protein
MAGRRFAARIACVLRWQEQSMGQVWLTGLGFGLFSGSVYGAVVSLLYGSARGLRDGLVFGAVGVLVWALSGRYRLGKRKDAEARLRHLDH